MKSSFDTVLIDPTRGALAARAAAEAANRRARVRTVSAPSVGVIDGPAGEWNDAGGRVTASADRRRAGPSRPFAGAVGAAWYTDAGGRRHVRVYGGRVECDRVPLVWREFAGVLPTQLHQVPPQDLVYPPPFGPTDMAGLRRGPGTRAFLAAIDGRPDERTGWLVLADWLDEHGREREAAAVRGRYAGGWNRETPAAGG